MKDGNQKSGDKGEEEGVGFSDEIFGEIVEGKNKKATRKGRNESSGNFPVTDEEVSEGSESRVEGGPGGVKGLGEISGVKESGKGSVDGVVGIKRVGNSGEIVETEGEVDEED